MNIIKLQNELRSVPDNALIGYVQNPTGNVPSYLALSELQRRKDMRSKYEAQQAPQSSVADDLEQEAAPKQTQGGLAMLAGQPQQDMSDQGVAGLPVPETMYQDQNFASGGIVAFGPGGEVATSRFGDYFSNLRAKNLAKEDINKQLNALISEKARLKYDFFTPLTAEQKAAQAETIPQIDAMIADLQSRKKGTSSSAPTATTGGPRVSAEQGLPSSFTGIDQSSQFQPSPNALTQMNQPPAPPAPSATGVARDPLGSLYKPLADRSADYDVLMRDEASAAENAMAKYKQIMGDDPMRPQLEEKLKKMEERSAKQEEQAPYMALIRAGFGMASGKSPYALQNIAEGATMGFEDYNKAKDKLETSREKQFDIQSRLAQAKRAEDIAATTHGLKSEEFIKAQNQANKLAKLGYQTNLEAANQKNKIDAYEAITKNKTADTTGRYYDILGKAAVNKTGAEGLDQDTIRRSYDSYLKGEFMDLPTGMSYDQFKIHTQGLAGAGLSPKAQSAYDKYKPK